MSQNESLGALKALFEPIRLVPFTVTHWIAGVCVAVINAFLKYTL